MATFLVLQLGDTHIKNEKNPILSRIDEILAAVRGEKLKPSACFIVAPGDIAFSGKAEEYRLAELFFRELSSRLEQEFPGVRCEVVLTPGNHDCDMSAQSDIRKSGAIRNLLRDIDLEGAYVKEQLAVQKAFFEFAAKFGQCQETSKDRLFTRREFVSDRRHTIAFNCYNTAWLSENPERPGTLFHAPIPSSVARCTADVEVAIFHHPYNWLDPDDAQVFQSYIEERSDIVLTGHEHHQDQYAKHRTGANIEYVGGQAMFDDSAASNGFNLLTVDLIKREWCVRTFAWRSKAYVAVGEEILQPRTFLRNRALLELGFVNNSTYANELSDLGTGFTHAKKHLKLNDVFVYPSLTLRILQQKLKLKTGYPARVKSNDLPGFILAESRLLILGGGPMRENGSCTHAVSIATDRGRACACADQWK
jgi:hypothetical protein